MMSISIKANSVQLHHNNGLKNKNKIILITMTFMFPRATQAKPMCLSITSLWCLSPSKVLVYLWNSLTCLPFYLKLKILHTFMKCLGAVWISCFHSPITQIWWVPRRRSLFGFVFNFCFHHSNCSGRWGEGSGWPCWSAMNEASKELLGSS